MGEIVFLGTGGGRFCTLTQQRATGGFRINTEKFNIHVDPGPGAIVRTRQYHQNAQNLNCVALSHAHPDHINDANIMVEAMTQGMLKQRGYVVGSVSAIKGTKDLDAGISSYHKTMPQEIKAMKPGDSVTYEGVKIEATKCMHRDSTTIGFKFHVEDKVIGYTSDTAYFEDLGKIYKGVDILIINLMRPRAARIPHHMIPEDVVKILKVAKPKLAIIQHFGMKMLDVGPAAEAEWIQKECGIRTIAVEDGEKVSFEETDQTTLSSF